MCGCSINHNPQFTFNTKSNLSIAISVSDKHEFYLVQPRSFLMFEIVIPIRTSVITIDKMVTEVCPNCRGAIADFMLTKSQQCRSHLTFTKPCRCPKSHNVSSSTLSSHYKLYSFTDSGWRTLFVALFWILVVFPTSTMSSPVLPNDQEAGPSSGRSPRSHRDHPAKWINPCRIPSSIPSFPVDVDIEIITQSDPEIIQNIITQVRKALHQARGFMNNFYQETFGEELQLRDKFTKVHYDFLKDINDKVSKSLGSKMSREELEELKVAETLRSMYAGLQMFAVGLEQIVLDQSVYGGNFHKDFQEAEYQLKYVLCELQIAMLEKGIKHEDVTREIMSGDYRDIDSSTIRNIRDWVIFRDYVNTLEYIQQSFQFFLRNMES